MSNEWVKTTETSRENSLKGDIERGRASIEVVYIDPTVLKKIKSNYLNNSDYALLINGNHGSHADIFAIMLLADDLMEEVNDNDQKIRLNGIDVIIALSLTSGHQNPRLKEYFDEAKKICSESNIDFLPIVRPEDEKKYGLSSVVNFALFKRAFSSYKDNVALMEFPEGTIKAGRVNLETGLHYGAQKTRSPSITDYSVEKYLKKEIPFNVLPVAIDGSYNIYDPDSYEFHEPQEKVRVTVGKLLGPDDFKGLEEGIKPSDLVMLKIIPNLSKENQGDYYPNL